MTRQPATRLPRLVSFLAWHGALGFTLGVLAAAAVIATDFGGLAHLMAEAGLGGIASAMLAFGFGITCGSVQMGFAVMMLPYDDGTDSDDRG